MKRNEFWKTDWFAAAVICIAFFFAAGSEFIQGLERWAYDFGVRAAQRDPGTQVAVIAIDDQSIDNLGRWPWSRSIQAKMVDILKQGGAKAVGYTVFLSEPQEDPGLVRVRELRAFVDSSGLVSAAPAGAELARRLASAETDLDTDSKLSTSIRDAANVVLAMQFNPGEPLGNPDQPLPDYVMKNALTTVDDRVGAEEGGLLPLSTNAAVAPIASMGGSAAAIGHLLNPPDVDGAYRFEPLVVRYYDQYFPSQALLLAARSLNLGVADIKLHLGEGVELGKLRITTDAQLLMHTFFYGDVDGRSPFPVDSFYDVYTGKIPPEKYRDKIVLIGPTAFGLGTTITTPVKAGTSPIVMMAHTVSSILNEHFFVTPAWSRWAELLAFVLVGGYLLALFPRLKAGQAAIASAVILVVLFSTHLFLMTVDGVWLQFMGAATLLAGGHVLLTTKKYLETQTGKQRADQASAESNRMLGLQFQQQGQLDMAYEKFRACPLDDTLMDPLYNLALDFERKRQFNKANSVYAYMAQHNPKFRDLEERMRRAKAMEDTVILGGGGGARAGGTMLLDGSISRPMLGRYEVEKELGKGAMGVVYQGRDPKINRIVAIKTMALSQEFEADELEEVKNRFFREAETAGRLQHPNIVTIYDAGEEHDLCYIAMELLSGKDLTAYTKEEALLPVQIVMGIVYKAALALDYAHKQNVVHRDVKPANIMYDPDAKKVKLTDFGIARITDSSKTKTGMVLGTPSYMSPEQLSGKRVDGRSDLFSLGVMLYQLVTGRLPFKGDSMATLMYQIANAPHPGIFEVRPDLATTKPCLAAIIDKALEKDMTRRYQSGEEMARELQACARQT